jgi:hypothetical protein
LCLRKWCLLHLQDFRYECVITSAMCWLTAAHNLHIINILYIITCLFLLLTNCLIKMFTAVYSMIMWWAILLSPELKLSTVNSIRHMKWWTPRYRDAREKLILTVVAVILWTCTWDCLFRISVRIHMLSCLRLCHPQPLGTNSGIASNQAMISSFEITSNSVFISHATIWHYSMI